MTYQQKQLLTWLKHSWTCSLPKRHPYVLCTFENNDIQYFESDQESWNLTQTIQYKQFRELYHGINIRQEFSSNYFHGSLSWWHKIKGTPNGFPSRLACHKTSRNGKRGRAEGEFFFALAGSQGASQVQDNAIFHSIRESNQKFACGIAWYCMLTSQSDCLFY